MKRFLKTLLFATLVTVVSMPVGAMAADQIINLVVGSTTVNVGATVTVSVNYDTSDSDNTLTSMAVRIHYDGNNLDYTGSENFFSTGSLLQAPEVYDDSNDDDQDGNTNKYILLSYADPLGGAFPNQPLPLKFVDLIFTAKTDAPAGVTTLNVSKVTGHAGYGFQGASLPITIAIPPGTVTGALSYGGPATGTFYVGAWDTAGFTDFDASAPANIVAGTTAYSMELPPGDYFLAAYRDTDGGGSTTSVELDDGEPRGFYALAAGAAGQSGNPQTVTVTSGGATPNIDVTIYDYPYFATNSVKVERHTFPATGLPAGFPTEEVLFVEAMPSFLPGSNQIQQVVVTGPGLSSGDPGVLKDDGILPDMTADDGMWSGWVSIVGGVNNGTYEVSALADTGLGGQMSADLNGTALTIPDTTAPEVLAATTTPLFQWDDVAGANDYDLILTTESTPTQFSQFDLIKEGLNTSEYQLLGSDLSLQENGSYYWLVQAFSADSQNSSFSAIKMFAVDTTKPGVTQVNLNPASPLAAGNVTATVTFDSLMNAATAPTVAYGANPFTGSFQNIVNGASTVWQGTATIGTGGDGNQTLSISGAKDLAGNTMDPDTSTMFVIDTTKPAVQSITLNPTAPVKAGEATFTITFGEPMNILAPLTVTFGAPPKTVTGAFMTGSTTVWAGTHTISTGYDGTQTISVSGGLDIAGNTMDTATGTQFVVDTTAPNTTPDIPAATYGVAQNVTLAAADAATTRTYYRLYADTAPATAPTTQDITTEATGPIALADAGPTSIKKYFLYWYSEDAAGNVEAVQSAAYVIDTNAPSTLATFNEPQPNQYGGAFYTTSNNVIVTLSSPTPQAPDNTVTIFYTTNGDTPTDQSASFAGTGSLAAFTAEGAHTVKYFAAKNAQGLTEQVKTLTLNIDNSAPAAPILNTVATPTNQTPQSIGGTKEANTGIYLNGAAQPIVAADSSTNWTYDLALVENSNAISLVAKDPAGNASPPAVSAIVLDTKAPTTASHNPAKGSVDQALNTQIVVNILDVGVGVDVGTIKLTVAGVEYISTSPAMSINDADVNNVVVTFTPPVIYAANTEVTVAVDAKDLAGNALAQDVYAFTTGDTVGVTPTTVGVAENAQITLTATGGSLPYNWSHSPGATVTPSLDSKTATFTAPADGTYTVTVTDDATATADATVTVVNPIVVSVAPNFGSIESDGTAAFSATGGTGSYKWSATGGSINADTGAFTAPTLTSGTQVITVTALDALYSGPPSPVKTDTTITVYPVIKLMTTPAGYVDGQPKTYPVLAYGTNTTLKAADATRNYDWSVADWDGTNVPGAAASGQPQFVVNPDTLFAGSGAGVYTVTIKDSANTNLKATFKVRVGMKIAPLSQNLTDAAGTIPFTVTGGPLGNVFNWAAKNLNGKVVTSANAGAFATASPTGATNTFNITNGIPAPIAFRVTASLDTAQAESNTDVERLIDAGLGSVMTQIFRIAPVVNYSGTVVETDGTTPIGGATLTALHDNTVTATTAGDGTFTIGPLNDVGITYKFVITKANYIDRVVTGAEIKAKTDAGDGIILKAIGAGGGNLTGDVNLRDVASGDAPKALIKVKADGTYITDDAGVVIAVITGANGNFSFPIPPDFATATTFTVEAQKGGYITNSLVVANNNPLAWPLAAGAPVILNPVTRIMPSCIAGADINADSVPDSVDCTIKAQAGTIPYQFDGTAAEAKVTMADGTAVTIAYDGANNAWTFNHPTYENIKFSVDADVSEVTRDVDTGYKATKPWQYVKSATAPAMATLNKPNLNGGSGASGSGDTNVTLPPGGLGGDIRDEVVVAILEADAADAGASSVTGSGIVEVSLTDEDGGDVDNADLERLEITIRFDPTVVTEGSLESGAFVIYQADSMADMVAGNFTAVSTSQIIPPVDYTNGLVTFWVDHLSSFGIGAAISSATGGGGGGGGGCFITTASGSPKMPIMNAGKTAMLLVVAAMLGLVFTVIRRKK